MHMVRKLCVFRAHADTILPHTVYNYNECTFRGKVLKTGTTFTEACHKW